MKAIQIIRPGEVAVINIPVPEPGPGEVLLKVEYAGFCGSDLSTYLGRNLMVTMPVIPGHEIGGLIEQAGAEVPDHIAKGRRCTVNPYTACGVCPSCIKGRPNACRDNRTLGVQRNGAMSEYIVVPWNKLIIDDEITPLRFALVEPMSVGFHAVSRASVTDVDTVLVIGCGMIGMGATVRASLRGSRVIALDVDDTKLEIARNFGASHTIKADENAEEKLMEITSGSLPDVTIEAAGSPATYLAALTYAGFSGRVACIGYAPSNVSLPTKLIVQKELDIRGSRNALPEDFRAVISCFKRNALPVEQFITSVCKPEEAGDALRNWADKPGEVFRILAGFSSESRKETPGRQSLS